MIRRLSCQHLHSKPHLQLPSRTAVDSHALPPVVYRVSVWVVDRRAPIFVVYLRPSHNLHIEVLRRSLESTQYTSIAFGMRCKQAGVRPSMGSVGDCFDNAMCESFFATLECELIDRNTFRSHAEAKLAIFEFIEGWYNPHRRHSALGYLSPALYERQIAERRTLA